MSEGEKDRFRRVDRAVDRVREELDEAVGGTRAAGSKASKEVREALDDVEEKVRKLRRREKDE